MGPHLLYNRDVQTCDDLNFGVGNAKQDRPKSDSHSVYTPSVWKQVLRVWRNSSTLWSISPLNSKYDSETFLFLSQGVTEEYLLRSQSPSMLILSKITKGFFPPKFKTVKKIGSNGFQFSPKYAWVTKTLRIWLKLSCWSDNAAGNIFACWSALHSFSLTTAPPSIKKAQQERTKNNRVHSTKR